MINVTKLINIVRKALRIIPKGKDGYGNERKVTVVNNAVVYRLGNDVFCGKKLLIVKGFAVGITEVDSRDAHHLLKAYYNVLNVGFPVEIRTYVMPLDKGSYLSKIDKKLDDLSLVLEVNPSSVKVRGKLDKLRRLRDLIVNEGLVPYDVIAVFATEACGSSVEGVIKTLNVRAKVLRDTLNSVGIRVEELRLSRDELVKLFFRFSSSSRGISKIKDILLGNLSINVIGYYFFTLVPFVISSVTNYLLRCRGVYLGRNLETNELVFWDVRKSMSPHIVIVGPTGSGKTEFLAVLTSRMVQAYDIASIIFDVKGEYSERLGRLGSNYVEYVVGRNAGLGIGKLLNYVPRKFRANWLTDLLSTVFTYEPMSKEVTSAFYRAANEVLTSLARVSDFNDVLDQIVSYVNSFEEPYVSYRIAKVIKLIKDLDRGSAVIDLIAARSGYVYVINLSEVLSLGINYVSLVSNIIVKTIEVYLSRIGRPSRKPEPTLFLVFDEGWAVLEPTSSVSEIVRLGRSYGLITALASQRVSDMTSKDPSIVSNAGLLVAMPSPDKDYWAELSTYLSISNEVIRRLSTTLGRGEAVIRISPDPRPLIIRFY